MSQTRPLIALAFSAMWLAHAAQAQEPRYKANVPDKIITPDVVEIRRLGTLNFTDGVPRAEIVQKVYDNLDFYRGVETFMVGIPEASMHAYLQEIK